jgi:hypothetical protein
MGWEMKRRVLMLVVVGMVRVMAGDFPEPVDSERVGGVPLMGAEEAAAAWQVPAGCRVTVVASEPEVRKILPIKKHFKNTSKESAIETKS